MSAELIAKALRRAYELGKIYWQQADSESYKQNRLSEGTHQKFEALIEETILAAQAPQAPAAQPLTDEQIDAVLAHCEKIVPDKAGWVVLQRREYARAIEREVAARRAHGIAPPAQGEPKP